jgi:arylsulfatase A-like enzyme
MMLRTHLHRAGVLLALLASGCARGDAELAVAFRLGPAAFARAAAGVRPPVLQIGDEARPVVDAPTVTTLAQQHAVPVRDARARFTVQLAPEARGLPDDAFQLAVQHVGTHTSGDEIEVGAAAIHFVRRDTGWRLLRAADDPSRVTFEIDEPSAGPDSKLEVQVQSIGRAAATLDSAPFVVPPRGRMLLGFGLARPPRDGVGESIFRAVLSCDARDDEVVFAERIEGAAAHEKRWHDTAFDLPRAGALCRLRLHVAGAAAEDGSGVWSIPMVLGATPRDVPALPNVVLISLDTLRADHLSAYGYPRATSPRIDTLLAARGTLFSDVSTTFPLTSPGHMSLMTGLSAGALPRPGMLDPWMPAPLLAERLRDAGYVTGAYTEDALLAGMFGFWFGFDRFVERPLTGEARGTETFRDGARFLRTNRGRRFFLFLHTYKVHAPYVSSPAYAKFADRADWQGVLADRGVPPEQQPNVDAYDRAIREVDDQVAGFLAELERLGLARDTQIVLLSDHGEAFGEHGLVGHGFGGQQEQLHIPLLLRGPGIPAGRRVAVPSSITDVVPTLLDLLGLPPIDADGRSLRAALSDELLPDDRALPFQWIGSKTRGVRQGSVKLLESATQAPLLYDLARDPGERDPLDDPALLASKQAALATIDRADAERRAALAASGNQHQGTVASERQMKSLRALGYVE